jgi:hypothetical protein
MNNRHIFQVMLWLALMPTPVMAQQDTDTIDWAEAEACFVGKALDPIHRCGGTASVEAFVRPERYPPETVDRALDVLESLALTSDNWIVRSSAIVSMGARLERYPELNPISRFERIYESTPHDEVRYSVIRLAPRRDEEALSRLLVRAIRDDRPSHAQDGIASLALRRLRFLGGVGRAHIAELKADSANLPDGLAKAYLMIED